MDDSIVTLFAVVVGAAIAAGASIGGEVLRSRHEGKLDSVQRRNDRWIERNRAQREVLADVQDKATEYVKKVVWIGRVFPIRDYAYLQEELYLRLELARLRVQVLDRELERLLVEVEARGQAIVQEETAEAVKAAATRLEASLLTEVTERAGRLIRDTYGLEPDEEVRPPI